MKCIVLKSEKNYILVRYMNRMYKIYQFVYVALYLCYK